MKNDILIDELNLSGQPLAMQVAERISQLIIQQHITAGEKIPNEFEIAEQLHVGRGTIREAVKLLVARNVLEIRRGKGTYVSKHTGVVDDPFGFAYIQDEGRLANDLLEMRLLIEPWAAKIAAERATDHDLEILRDACASVSEKIRANEDYVFEDARFHICISRCTQSLVLPKLLPVIVYSVHQLNPLNKSVLSNDQATRQRTLETHEKILNAICDHDPVTAEQAMIEHLSGNRPGIDSYIKKQTLK